MIATTVHRTVFTPLHTGQARLAACHGAATRLQALDWGNQPERSFRDARDVLRDTIRVLADLVEAVDVPNVHAAALRGDSTSQFGIQLDAILQGPRSDDRVGDLAFIAAGQLRRKLAALEDAQQAFEANPSAMRLAHFADALGSSIRHVLRATCIVEPELARVRGLTPRLSLEAERARSLAVRRAYTHFRRAVQAAARDREGLLQVQQALRALLLDVAYRDVRPSDRVQIEALRDRVEDALAMQGSASAIEHLMTDVASFASMLRVVSRREVLVNHDHQVLPQIIAQMSDLMARGRPVLRGHLDAIRGIDDEVEALLEPGLAIDGARLLVLLERAHDERVAAAGGGFA
jgi:hypothetical protein